MSATVVAVRQAAAHRIAEWPDRQASGARDFADALWLASLVLGNRPGVVGAWVLSGDPDEPWLARVGVTVKSARHVLALAGCSDFGHVVQGESGPEWVGEIDGVHLLVMVAPGRSEWRQESA